MGECEEYRCAREATKAWHGRYVCGDHYHMYWEEIDKIRMKFQI